MTATCVVNIKAREEYDVFIGRPSIWGNPYHVGKHGTRAQVIAMYRDYVTGSAALMREIESLRGKRLGCYCAPAACHGDVLVDLLEMAQELQKKVTESCPA